MRSIACCLKRMTRTFSSGYVQLKVWSFGLNFVPAFVCTISGSQLQVQVEELRVARSTPLAGEVGQNPPKQRFMVSPLDNV